MVQKCKLLPKCAFITIDRVPDAGAILPRFSGGSSSMTLVSAATSPLQPDSTGTSPPGKLTKPSLSHPGAVTPQNRYLFFIKLSLNN